MTTSKAFIRQKGLVLPALSKLPRKLLFSIVAMGAHNCYICAGRLPLPSFLLGLDVSMSSSAIFVQVQRAELKFMHNASGPRGLWLYRDIKQNVDKSKKYNSNTFDDRSKFKQLNYLRMVLFTPSISLVMLSFYGYS